MLVSYCPHIESGGCSIVQWGTILQVHHMIGLLVSGAWNDCILSGSLLVISLMSMYVFTPLHFASCVMENISLGGPLHEKLHP
jgi:hypothetical protein